MKKELFKAAQIYGTYKAWASAITMTILGIIGIIICINYYFDNKDYVKVQATIVNTNCNEFTKTEIQNYKHTNRQVETTNKLYKCNLDLEYNINNKKYDNILVEEYDNKPNKGDKIEIGYKPNNPNNISKNFEFLKYGSILGLIIIIIFIIASYVNLHIVRKNKTIAGIEGTVGFASNLRRALSSRRRNNY